MHVVIGRGRAVADMQCGVERENVAGTKERVSGVFGRWGATTMDEMKLALATSTTIEREGLITLNKT